MFLRLKVFQQVSVHIHVEDANTSNRKLVISLVLDDMTIENSVVSDTLETKKKKKRVSMDGSTDEKPPAKKSKGKASKKK